MAPIERNPVCYCIVKKRSIMEHWYLCHQIGRSSFYKFTLIKINTIIVFDKFLKFLTPLLIWTHQMNSQVTWTFHQSTKQSSHIILPTVHLSHIPRSLHSVLKYCTPEETDKSRIHVSYKRPNCYKTGWVGYYMAAQRYKISLLMLKNILCMCYRSKLNSFVS